MYSLVGGHVEPGESFRDCCIREIMEELELTPDADFRVAESPIVPTCEYTAVSGSAGVPTLYSADIYAVHILNIEASMKIDANQVNRWLNAGEIAKLSTSDGRLISDQVRTLFTMCGVM